MLNDWVKKRPHNRPIMQFGTIPSQSHADLKTANLFDLESSLNKRFVKAKGIIKPLRRKRIQRHQKGWVEYYLFPNKIDGKKPWFNFLCLAADLEDSKGHGDQLSNVGRQNAVKVTSDSSSLSQPFSACAGALRKGFETETRPCEENTSSVDIIDTNGGGDEDNDFDFPTFDLISSLGI